MKSKDQEYKVGSVALVGRPNVGKSTLLNAIVGQKVSIVSGKPQTTRSEITAVYEDDRGQIFFSDTPGYYQGKAISNYNRLIATSLKNADVVVYVVDRTRDWGEEDERIWNMIQNTGLPTVLIINKTDIASSNFDKTYELLVGKHVEKVLKVSAIGTQHIKSIATTLFPLLPAGKRNEVVDRFPTPLISHSSSDFLAELVREKVYERCGAEVPYNVRVRISDINENEEKNTLYIKGFLIVSDKHYKPMLIGANGRMISAITKAVQKELWVATGKETKVRLEVVTDSELDF